MLKEAPATVSGSAAPLPSTQLPEVYSPCELFHLRKHFGSLDGLRAVSILGVIWHHSAAAAFAVAVPFVHQGNRGVNLFFAISAFLISTLLIRSRERHRLNVPRFWVRRALRILPLYFAVLAVYVVLVAATERDVAAREGFFANLRYFATFTSNWFVQLDSPRVIFYFAWSLAAEEQFYLCWPWIERKFSGVGPVVIALGGLLVSQGARFVHDHSEAPGVLLKIVSSVPAAILAGVVLAHVLNSRRGFRMLWPILGRRGSAIAAGLVTVLAIGVEPWLGFAGEPVVAVSLALLVGACVIREDNDLARLLAWRPVVWIGIVSYGIYLVHMLAISSGRRALEAMGIDSPFAVFAAGTAVAITVASLSYVTFERFFLRLKDRIPQ